MAPLEPEDVECLGDRVHVPDVAHAFPGVEAHLLDLVDAALVRPGAEVQLGLIEGNRGQSVAHCQPPVHSLFAP